MRVSRNTSCGVLVAFTLTTLTHSSTVSAAPPTERPAAEHASVFDVELAADHSLSGQLFGSEGQPKAGAVVRIVAEGGSEATTDSQGRFRLKNVQAGVLHLSADNVDQAVRCWAPGTAPPRAAQRILLSSNQQIQRGQRPIADLLSGPVLIGLIIAAAIAIPIAIHNSKDAS